MNERRRTSPAIGLLAVLAVAGCGGGGGGPSDPPAPAPFEVVSTLPVQGADDVAPESVIVRIDLTHAASAATAVASAVTAEIDDVPVPTLVTWAGDRTSVEVLVGGAAPGGAQVEVDLLGVLREIDDAALEAGSALPLRFRIAPDEVQIPPAPGDPGRLAPAGARLADGRLLLTGGLGQDGVVRADAAILAAQGTVTPIAANLGLARWAHVAGALADGRVLVAGGFTDAAGTVSTAASETWDPATGLFAAGPALATPRGGASLVRTSDGLLVVLGGAAEFGGDATTASIEAYDAALGAFTTLSTGLPVATTDAAVAPLEGGSFLVAGGADASGAVLETAYAFEPDDTMTRSEVAGGLVVGRRGACAALSPTGDVYVFGGVDATGSFLSSVERFDPVTEAFEALPATLSEARSHATAVVLANGAIAVVGGIVDAEGHASPAVDVFDPSTGDLLSSHVLATPIAFGVALPTPSGGVALAGGAIHATLPPSNRISSTVLTASALGAAIPAPAVVGFTPTSGSALVDVDAEIRVRFSKGVEPASLVGAIVVTDSEGKAVAGATTLESDGVTAVFAPESPLPVLQTIGVEVKTTVVDRLGNALVDDGTRFCSFRTGYDLLLGGADDGSQFGYAVAAGDVNGDGIADLAVSAYVAEPAPGSGVKPGQVYVIFGRSDVGPADGPLHRDLASPAGAADLTISFETDGDQPGIESALQVADLDDDGYADVIVGAHNADGPSETNSNMGEVFVVFGQASFPSPTLTLGKVAVPGFDVLRVYGAATSDRFGEGMATGDVDGDGFLDLLVGSRFVGTTGASNVGAVYVVFGGSKSTLGVVGGFGVDHVGASASTLANVRVLGTDASDNLGWSAASGDLDGDGYAEIVGGSTGGDGAANSASSSGEAVVVFGAPRSTLVPSGLFAEYRAGPATVLPAFVLHGDDAGDFLAWSLRCGDLDADGKADLAMGALLSDGPGNVGNGRGELAIAFGASRATFLPGGATWAAYDLGAGPHPFRLLRLHGEADGHSFGDCSEMADVDGDGTTDLVVGDYQARGPLDAVGANVGELSVLRGAGLVPSTGTLEFALSTSGATHPAGVTLTRFYGKTTVVRFGTTISVADFNDDGRLDLLTGANQAKGLGRLFSNGGEAYVLWGRDTWWK